MSAAKQVTSIFANELLKGKVAIVTGGATGIGCAITQELLHLGCNVMIASRGYEKLENAAKEIRKYIDKGNQAKLETIKCNIRDETQVNKLMEETISRFGQLDYLVNNAGGQFISPTSDISAKGWNAVLETNLTGTFYCCKAAYNYYMSKHGGVIVNIIADMIKGMAGMSHSGAARAGVDNLTKSLSIEWANKGIRVNAVIPGSSIYSETAAKNYGAYNVFEKQVVNIPAKRLGTPEEISAAVIYLLSPGASFITGYTLKVDGGHSLYKPSIPIEIPDHSKFPEYKWIDEAVNKSKL